MENKILGSKGLARLIENISNTFSKIGHTHTKSQISDFPAIPTDNDISEMISSACEDVVLHTEQTLTEEQKKQARDNIGVGETIADTLFALDLANPIVEDDGEYLATADGIILTFNEEEEPAVKTINGIAPDENGNVEILIPEMPDINYPVTSVNGMTGDVVIEVSSGSSVQADMAQNDPAQPDYVKNRTHWVDGNQTVIEWDGNTEGLEFFTAEVTYYHVSDSTPTIDELIGASYETGMVDSGVSATSITSEMLTVFGDCIAISAGVPLIVIATIDNAATGDSVTTISKAGVYFINAPVYGYASKLTYGSTTYHPLDEAFIPDTIARTADIPEVNYPVTSVNGMTGDVVIEAGSGGGVTSWNDLEDKPFYEEGDLEAIIENESPEIQNDDGLIQCETLIIPLVAGEKYKVILDGMEYQFTATEAELYGDQFVYIGSEQMFNDINAGTNGDFFIASVWEDGQCVYTALVYYTDNTTITLSVYKDATVIHPLDEKFIPDTIARVEDIPHVMEIELLNQEGSVTAGNRELLSPNNDVGFEGQESTAIDNDVSDTVAVIFDGVRYECETYRCTSTLVSYTGNVAIIGNLKSLESDFDSLGVNSTDYPLGEEYPFAIIITDSGSSLFFNVHLAEAASADETHTFQILSYQPSAVINDMFIPDTIARKSDISVCSWNDLTDKPSPKVNGVITWDGSTSGRETFKRGSIDYYKVSDLPSSNLTFTRSENNNGYGLNSTSSSFTVTEGEGATAYGGNNFIVVYSENFTIGSDSWEGIAPGVYFGKMTYNGMTGYTTSVTYKCPVPDAVGETVTAAEFNALLAALREAGYLAT